MQPLKTLALALFLIISTGAFAQKEAARKEKYKADREKYVAKTLTMVRSSSSIISN